MPPTVRPVRPSFTFRNPQFPRYGRGGGAAAATSSGDAGRRSADAPSSAGDAGAAWDAWGWSSDAAPAAGNATATGDAHAAGAGRCVGPPRVVVDSPAVDSPAVDSRPVIAAVAVIVVVAVVVVSCFVFVALLAFRAQPFRPLASFRPEPSTDSVQLYIPFSVHSCPRARWPDQRETLIFIYIVVRPCREYIVSSIRSGGKFWVFCWIGPSSRRIPAIPVYIHRK